MIHNTYYTDKFRMLLNNKHYNKAATLYFSMAYAYKSKFDKILEKSEIKDNFTDILLNHVPDYGMWADQP
jgi:hypothetical protein